MGGLDIDFEFHVGDTERHRVAFHWGQLFGRVRITVDYVEVVGQNKPLSLSSNQVRTFEFTVGNAEQHTVRIEKIRKHVLGGARKQACRAYVDDALVGEYQPSRPAVPPRRRTDQPRGRPAEPLP
jgi:hypothetical protein